MSFACNTTCGVWAWAFAESRERHAPQRSAPFSLLTGAFRCVSRFLCPFSRCRGRLLSGLDDGRRYGSSRRPIKRSPQLESLFLSLLDIVFIHTFSQPLSASVDWTDSALNLSNNTSGHSSFSVGHCISLFRVCLTNAPRGPSDAVPFGALNDRCSQDCTSPESCDWFATPHTWNRREAHVHGCVWPCHHALLNSRESSSATAPLAWRRQNVKKRGRISGDGTCSWRVKMVIGYADWQ